MKLNSQSATIAGMFRVKKTKLTLVLVTVILLFQTSCGQHESRVRLEKRYAELENVVKQLNDKYWALDNVQKELKPAEKHDQELWEKKYSGTSDVVFQQPTPLMIAWDKIDTLKMTMGHTEELIGTTRHVKVESLLGYCQKRIAGLKSLKRQSTTALDFLKPSDPKNPNPYVVQQLKEAKDIISSLPPLCDRSIEIYQEVLKIVAS